MSCELTDKKVFTDSNHLGSTSTTRGLNARHANSSYEVLIHALSRPTAPEHATRTCEATVDTLLRAHPLHRTLSKLLYRYRRYDRRASRSYQLKA